MSNNTLNNKTIIWSTNIAYAIGLITTDGNISSDKRHISLTSSDKELLETFSRCVYKNNKIGINPKSQLSKKVSYRVQFGDVKLYNWLTKIGLIPNKSLTLSSLNINKKYFKDFLRGHLDGDGSIISYEDKYNSHINPKYIYKRIFVYFISSSQKHIEWLRNVIFKIKNIKGSISINKPNNQIGKNPTFRLKFSTKEAIILLNWIYYKNDLPCLNRKYLIAKPFLNV